MLIRLNTLGGVSFYYNHSPEDVQSLFSSKLWGESQYLNLMVIFKRKKKTETSMTGLTKD